MIYEYVSSLTLVIHIHDLFHELKVSLNDLKTGLPLLHYHRQIYIPFEIELHGGPKDS